MWHDVLPVIEGADANPARGVYWRHHLDYWHQHRARKSVRDRDTLKQHLHKDEVIRYGLAFFENVRYDISRTHLMAAKTPLDDYLRYQELRDADNEALRKGALLEEDRVKIVETQQKTNERERTPAQIAAKKAREQAEALRRLRERGTIHQGVREARIAEETDTVYHHPEEDDSEEEFSTNREARRGQFISDLTRRRRIHSKALPRDVAEQLFKEETAAGVTLGEAGESKAELGSRLTPAMAKIHELKQEAEKAAREQAEVAAPTTSVTPRPLRLRDAEILGEPADDEDVDSDVPLPIFPAQEDVKVKKPRFA